jgi:hypothetical protein
MRPAHQVVTRSPHRSVGIVAAPWLQAMPIEHESMLEKSFIEIALACPIVQSLRHQPFKLTYQLDGKQHTNVPDFLLRCYGGFKVVVEVKPEVFVAEQTAKFNAISALLAQRDLLYYVVTDTHINRMDVERARLWRRYARTKVNQTDIAYALAAVPAGKEVDLNQLLKQGIQIEVLYHLLGRRQLIAVYGLSLSPSSKICQPKLEDLRDEHFFFNHWFGCAPWGADMAPGT